MRLRSLTWMSHSNSTYYYHAQRKILSTIPTALYWHIVDKRIRAQGIRRIIKQSILGPMTRWIARVFRERCELCGHVMSNHNVQPNGLGECNICRRVSGQCQLEPYRSLQPVEIKQSDGKRVLLGQLDKRLKLRMRNIQL